MIVCVLLVMQIIVVFNQRPKEREYSDVLYKQFCDRYAGVYEQSLKNLLISRKAWIYERLAEHDKIEGDYHAGMVELAEFSAYIDNYNEAVSQKATVDYLLLKCDYYDSLNDSAEVFYDTRWLDLFERSGFDFLCVFAVIILLVPAFVDEYSWGARTILVITPLGRIRTALTKLIICAVSAVLLGLIFKAASLLPLITEGSIKYAGNSAYNLLGYPFKNNDSLIKVYIIFSLVKALEVVCMAMLICFLSVMLQNRVFVYFLSSMLLFCPALFKDQLSEATAYLSSSYASTIPISPHTGLVAISLSCVFRIVLFVALSVAVWVSRYQRKEI